MMQTLLEGEQPDLRDVVYIRSALLVGSNLYAPHAELLSGRFKGHSLDVSRRAVEGYRKPVEGYRKFSAEAKQPAGMSARGRQAR